MKLAARARHRPYLSLATLPLVLDGAHLAQARDDTISPARAVRARSLERDARTSIARLPGHARRLPRACRSRCTRAPRSFWHHLGNSVVIGAALDARLGLLGTSAPTASAASASPAPRTGCSSSSRRASCRRSRSSCRSCSCTGSSTSGHAPRARPALHRVQPLARGLADEGLHRRDPARLRGGGAGRRLLAARTRSCASSCRRRAPAWR